MALLDDGANEIRLINRTDRGGARTGADSDLSRRIGVVESSQAHRRMRSTAQPCWLTRPVRAWLVIRSRSISRSMRCRFRPWSAIFVYNPLETPLLGNGRASAATLPSMGLGMLLHQAVPEVRSVLRRASRMCRMNCGGRWRILCDVVMPALVRGASGVEIFRDKPGHDNLSRFRVSLLPPRAV